MTKWYRFPSPWNVAEYFTALGLFTDSDYQTIWNDCRVAVVCGEEKDMPFIDGYAKQFHGKEIPQP